jgi:hypothetical protein
MLAAIDLADVATILQTYLSHHQRNEECRRGDRQVTFRA